MGREDMVKIDDTSEFEDYALVWGSVESLGLAFEAETLYQPSPRGIPTPEFPEGCNVVELATAESGRRVYVFAKGEEWYMDDFESTLMVDIMDELQMRYCEGYMEAVMAM